ncbi:hypothetical protein K439DRAFT_1616037 [Ramaria rubella]|nr:hypothetical protein K439DRAFT_1616037 [Ramaria rubella]
MNNDGREYVFLTFGGPIFASIGLFSQGTHIWFTFDLSGGMMEDTSIIVVIKDSWIHDRRTPKGNFYNVVASFNDDPFHTTVTHNNADVCSCQYCHTVINTLGHQLSRYKSMKELVQGIDSAVAGHQKALERGVLHRDISEWNVMLPLIAKMPSDTDCVHGKGWDLMGTIQFMTVAWLQNRNIHHVMWHDLGPFFWVLLYMVARHTSNSWVTSLEQKVTLLCLFDARSPPSLATLRQGFLERYRDTFTVHNNAALTNRIHNLAVLFANAYPPPQYLGQSCHS